MLSRVKRDVPSPSSLSVGERRVGVRSGVSLWAVVLTAASVVYFVVVLARVDATDESSDRSLALPEEVDASAAATATGGGRGEPIADIAAAGAAAGLVSAQKRRHLPSAFALPWVYGLRADKGYGGNDDAELLDGRPVGVLPQVPVAEAVFMADEASTSPLGRGRAADSSPFVAQQLLRLRRRLYDAAEVLEGFAFIAQNQRRVAREWHGRTHSASAAEGETMDEGGHVPVALDELRSREDEMPLVINWR